MISIVSYHSSLLHRNNLIRDFFCSFSGVLCGAINFVVVVERLSVIETIHRSLNHGVVCCHRAKLASKLWRKFTADKFFPSSSYRVRLIWLIFFFSFYFYTDANLIESIVFQLFASSSSSSQVTTIATVDGDCIESKKRKTAFINSTTSTINACKRSSTSTAANTSTITTII